MLTLSLDFITDKLFTMTTDILEKRPKIDDYELHSQFCGEYRLIECLLQAGLK